MKAIGPQNIADYEELYSSKLHLIPILHFREKLKKKI